MIQALDGPVVTASTNVQQFATQLPPHSISMDRVKNTIEKHYEDFLNHAHDKVSRLSKEHLQHQVHSDIKQSKKEMSQARARLDKSHAAAVKHAHAKHLYRSAQTNTEKLRALADIDETQNIVLDHYEQQAHAAHIASMERNLEGLQRQKNKFNNPKIDRHFGTITRELGVVKALCADVCNEALSLKHRAKRFIDLKVTLHKVVDNDLKPLTRLLNQ